MTPGQRARQFRDRTARENAMLGHARPNEYTCSVCDKPFLSYQRKETRCHGCRAKGKVAA